jgi:hypothetical protein
MHIARDPGIPLKMIKQSGYVRNYLFWVNGFKKPRCSGSEILLKNYRWSQNLQWACSLFQLYARTKLFMPVSSAENS